MPISIVDGPTIAAGESLSDAADCSAGQIVRFTVPQEFTAANLTFQISSNGASFNDMYDDKRREVTLGVKANSGICILEPALWRSAAFVKIRSGTAAYPVAQAVTCKFAIAVETAA